MKKRFNLLCSVVAALFASFDATSQCGQGPCTVPVAAYEPNAACILPNEQALTCYHGETVNSGVVIAPLTWCTTVENNQWFAFIASSPNVSLELSVGPCSFGGALQAALLSTTDCVNFEFVSDCYSEIADGTTVTVSNNVPLVPGQVYYLMIDGWASANCQFSINDPIQIVGGPTNLCLPDGQHSYYNGTESVWTINPPSAGTILNQMPANFADIQWLQTGNAQVCAVSTSCPGNPAYCIDVFVETSYVDSTTLYLCPAESVFCGNLEVFTPGFYSDLVPAPNGCDSILYCEVVESASIPNDLGQIVMPCEGYYVVCGEVISELGFFDITCQNWQGCDSTVTFTLLQGDVYANAGQDITLPCQGGSVNLDGSASSQGVGFSYQWTTTNGHIIIGDSTTAPAIDTSGTYCLNVTNLNTGCVMTDCAMVFAPDSVEIHINQSICEGETYLFDGQSIVQPGTYFAVYQTSAGCDSTVALNLSIWPNFESSSSFSICDGEFVTWNGQTISAGGIYVDSLQTAHGCDSIVILDLEVLPNSDTTINATICQGGIYLVDGQPYNVAGEYSVMLTNSQGCDSLVTLNLSVEPAPVSSDTVSVVEGTIYNGITLLSDTTIMEVHTDGFGCEFVFITHFIVLPNGTDELLEGFSFEVFPNPATGQFYVNFGLVKQNPVQLEVVDVLGRAVYQYSQAREFDMGEHQLTLNSTGWASGVYIVRLRVGNAIFAQKIVIA